MSEWTSIAQPMHYIVELDAPLTVRRERGVLVQGDENANAFVLAIYQQKGVPADLTGCTVTLTFLRPDNLVVPPIAATIDGNVATATLTAACYRVSGMYGVLVTLAKDGAERTILKTIGDMISTENSGMVDEEGVFPTPEELLAALEQVETARQNANTAAENANANAEAANAAAGAANSAATAATDAATAANTATSNANAAADRANQAAAEVEGGTAPDSNKLGGIPASEYLQKTETAADSSKLGGKAPEYYLSPRNMLDNSWMGGPIVGGVKHELVNQRGLTSYAGSTYTIDRWRMWSDAGELALEDGSVNVTGYLYQYFIAEVDKVYTFAVKKKDGTLLIVSGKPSTSQTANGLQIAARSPANKECYVVIQGVGEVVWAALYEGEYTTETLPPYVPKGYETELIECRRYYQPNCSAIGRAINTGYIALSFNYSPPMRTTPTKTANSLKLNGVGDSLITGAITIIGDNTHTYQCSTGSVAITAGSFYQLIFDASADL